jgi:hypothetical protein
VVPSARAPAHLDGEESRSRCPASVSRRSSAPRQDGAWHHQHETRAYTTVVARAMADQVRCVPCLPQRRQRGVG